MNVTSNQEFTGVAKAGSMINAVIAGGPATLQEKAADGTWIDVPDGAGTSTAFTFYAPVQAIFRFNFSSGSVAIYR